jgi:hypothetical protein
MSKNKKLKINVEILYDDFNNKSGVVMKYKDFQKLIDTMEDFHDLYVAYQHKGKKFKTIPFEQVIKEALGKDANK